MTHNSELSKHNAQDTAAPSLLPPREGLAEHSRFVQRVRRRYADQFSNLIPGQAPQRANIQQALQIILSEQGEKKDISAALRIVRQWVIERLIVLDCERRAELPIVTRAVTELAELSLDAALTHTQHTLDERHGAPLVPQTQQRAQLWIIGMGKLGARELNVSSDIDLIYIYDHDGETSGRADGGGKISNHEYFTRAVKMVHALIGETTEHGFVFRVDLALRPHGNSGPPALSLSALEDYLHSQGREWERFAWMKSRVVAPRACLAQPQVQALRGVVLPFVFRKYLDYSVFEALRNLHHQIREHAGRQSVGRPERANDVKLGRGGIREIEFIVQLLQVVRGGQFPELRCRPTLEALQRLSRATLMPAATAQQLEQAYIFLRQVEHRIQYLDDQQTHILPTRSDDLDWIAKTLDFSDSESFTHTLNAHREVVAREFDALLGGQHTDHALPLPLPTHASHAAHPHAPAQGQTQAQASSSTPVPSISSISPIPHSHTTPCAPASTLPATPTSTTELIASFPPALHERLHAWHDSARVQSLREDTRLRLLKLLHRTSHWLAQGHTTPESVLQLLDWMDAFLRRESYLVLLLERPKVHLRLLHMLGAARWPVRYLRQHPGVIDELASDDMFTRRFVPEDFEDELQRRLQSLRNTGEDDDEELLSLLRRAHHAETFRTLARDVEGHLSVEQVADDLSALADAVLRVTVQWCWQRLKNRHLISTEQPQFAIIGYGKLGGKELGYGSDLDIVFLYDDKHENAQEVYAALVRKLITWLTVKTSEGDLFEIDTALRPNGNSGLLVTTFEAFANYQQQRGSNTAWTWEHQAMTRARFVLGSAELQQRFDAVRQSVICAPRDITTLREEIMHMRERVRQAHPVKNPQQFDVKHSPGGMVDAEFAVQYLVLSQSCQHPELQGNVGNIALLQRAETAGLLPPHCGQHAGAAYRTLRQIQHRARLNEQPTQVPLDEVQKEREAILALWSAVFKN